jgi:hypothetical protein
MKLTINKRQQNKIKTPGYFIKRMRDSGYGVLRVFQQFSIIDPRKWIVLIDPGGASILLTCYHNKDFNNQVMFEFNDGGNYFPKNYSVSTESIEVIVQILVERGIPTINETDKFYKQKPERANSNDNP